SFGCSLYLGDSIIYMKTMVATLHPIEVDGSEHGCDEEKKGTTCGKSRVVRTSLEARVS
ncbi:hypothetical protein PanWU01x14_155090, partial [Parasponia andersonii]